MHKREIRTKALRCDESHNSSIRAAGLGLVYNFAAGASQL
jgi:hypothetical protein